MSEKGKQELTSLDYSFTLAAIKAPKANLHAFKEATNLFGNERGYVLESHALL